MISKIDSQKLNAIQEVTITCKCGHRVTLDEPYKKCSHCGKMHYRSEREEFIYKIAQKTGHKIKIRRR